MLQDIFPEPNLEKFKVHFARWNQKAHPLEVYGRSLEEWQGWQEYRPGRDDFNRPHIFSLMHVYYEPNMWLFGGIWDVKKRLADQYVVEMSDTMRGFCGRLKLRSAYKNRTTRTNFENHYHTFEVAEILSEPYSGRPFPGFSDIDLSFDELETVVRNNRLDWRASLENMKGVYLITDVLTGKRYVGSAYGEQGIWSRWCSYVGSGHGGNIELRNLVTDPSLEYCRTNFRFALLEHISSRESDDRVIAREGFWKQILLTRGDFGFNRN